MGSLLRRQHVLPWWAVVWAGINVGLIAYHVAFDWHSTNSDWELWRALPSALAAGRLYDIEGIKLWYAWSPVMAPIMALVGLIGWVPWLLIHFLTLAFIRNWILIGLMAISWGFWIDLFAGNTFTFVVVAGILAFGGSRRAALVYMGLCFLMPRPVQLPLALWLLWKMPDIWKPSAVLFGVHGIAVLGTGYALDWLAIAGQTVQVDWNMHPFSAFGLWWLIAGIPLGLLLVWRGHPGWAGLAISTYWVPTYLMIPLVEAGRLKRPVMETVAGTVALEPETTLPLEPA